MMMPILWSFRCRVHLEVSTVRFILKSNLLINQRALSLPSLLTQIVFFLALARASARDTALVLANLEDYERESSLQLQLGEVIITPHHALLSADTPQSVILFRTATSLDCSKVPDCQTIEGKPTLFFFVVPLTTEECEFRCQHGHDALISRFQADQKDIFF